MAKKCDTMSESYDTMSQKIGWRGRRVVNLQKKSRERPGNRIKPKRKMGKRARLTDDSLNSYGSRILTAGMDTTQYERNPVLLWMHQRGEVIGYMKEIRTEDGCITAEPVFDEASELSKRCKKQWEAGSLRMVSVGIDIVETSESPEVLLPGQKCPTITKSRLFEVSIVDIGANDNALVMRRDGRQITLGRDSENPLPQIKGEPTTNQNQQTKMEKKTIALMLGLAESADESAITAKITELKAAKEEAERLRAAKEKIEGAAITAAVDTAIKEKRLEATRKEQFIKLGKQIGLESLQETLQAMTPAVKPLDVINQKDGDGGSGGKSAGSYSKLSEVPADQAAKLKKENEAEYRRLFKAEYGFDY